MCRVGVSYANSFYRNTIDCVHVLVFISGNFFGSSTEPGPVLIFAAKTSTDERFWHTFVKDYGDVHMHVQFMMKSHV